MRQNTTAPTSLRDIAAECLGQPQATPLPASTIVSCPTLADVDIAGEGIARPDSLIAALKLAGEMAQATGGAIELERSALGGLKVSFRWPAAQNVQPA